MELSKILAHSQYLRFKERSVSVEGWFTDMSAALFDAFMSFQKARGTGGDFLEIGIAYGKAALMLAAHGAPGDVVRLVDCSEAQVAGTTALVQGTTQSRVEGIFGFSEALPHDLFPSRATRFMHIDGDHGRWALHNDLDIAHRTLGADGMVALDDFLAPQFIGVTIGAIEWMTRNPEAFEMVLVGFNKAYLVRPRVAMDYYVFIRDMLPGFFRSLDLHDFTFSRTDVARACGTFGLTARQFDLDILTRERAMGLPEVLVEGKIVI